MTEATEPTVASLDEEIAATRRVLEEVKARHAEIDDERTDILMADGFDMPRAVELQGRVLDLDLRRRVLRDRLRTLQKQRAREEAAAARRQDEAEAAELVAEAEAVRASIEDAWQDVFRSLGDALAAARIAVDGKARLPALRSNVEALQGEHARHLISGLEPDRDERRYALALLNILTAVLERRQIPSARWDEVARLRKRG